MEKYGYDDVLSDLKEELQSKERRVEMLEAEVLWKYLFVCLFVVHY